MTADEARAAALKAAIDCYGGALGIAAVHGWRFRGDVTEDDWPVSFVRAIELAQVEAAIEAVGKVLCLCPSQWSDTCSKHLVLAALYEKRAALAQQAESGTACKPTQAEIDAYFGLTSPIL